MLLEAELVQRGADGNDEAALERVVRGRDVVGVALRKRRVGNGSLERGAALLRLVAVRANRHGFFSLGLLTGRSTCSLMVLLGLVLRRCYPRYGAQTRAMGSVTPLQRQENLERLVLEHEEWQKRTSEAELAREARLEKRADSRMFKVVSLVMVVLSFRTRAPRGRGALGRRPSTYAHETRQQPELD